MDLLSGETGTRFVVAIIAVGGALAAFAAILWFLRNRPVAPLLTRSNKDRQKRLSVIDATMIDARRRAILIRRDNVEHLILIGGPADIVIESGIAPLGSVTRGLPSSEHAPPPAALRQQMAEPSLFEDLPEQPRHQQRDYQPATGSTRSTAAGPLSPCLRKIMNIPMARRQHFQHATLRRNLQNSSSPPALSQPSNMRKPRTAPLLARPCRQKSPPCETRPRHPMPN